jgi:hypothetical protein
MSRFGFRAQAASSLPGYFLKPENTLPISPGSPQRGINLRDGGNRALGHDETGRSGLP